ncbi:piezo-type mechanosensitive ion channel component 2-like [Thomomys bottae]
MVSASVITLLLPILIFLWAMLSVPRPSRRFWMMAIVYIEVAIVVKYFFQFGFFPWNKNVELYKDKPYHPPNIIGVEKEGYVLYDLIQLLALFFHRSILKGCWWIWSAGEFSGLPHCNTPNASFEHKDVFWKTLLSKQLFHLYSSCQSFLDLLYQSIRLLAASPLSFPGTIVQLLYTSLPWFTGFNTVRQNASSPTGNGHFPCHFLSPQCHGLWDEDDIVDSGTDKEESDDELSLRHGRRDSSDSLKSINLAASVESVHVTFPEQPTAFRRKRSSSNTQISPGSSFSSNRSKRGSTSTRNSSQKGSSVLSIKQKSKRELYMEKLQEHLIKAKAFTIKKTLQIYVPIRQFLYDLIHPDYSAVTDVYVLMFLADTVDFIIIVFGFWAFGKHSAAADITSSLSEDQVPGPFLVMVLIQFGTMVVDRALYLRKTVLGKVIFQVILVFGIHFWMFFILPSVTERKFSQNLVAQLWYFVKCVYFGLSAYQIRCGYPTRVLGNFLTKSYNYVNLFLF